MHLGSTISSGVAQIFVEALMRNSTKISKQSPKGLIDIPQPINRMKETWQLNFQIM